MKKCPFCDASPELMGRGRSTYARCKQCGFKGPMNDPGGKKWDSMPRRGDEGVPLVGFILDCPSCGEEGTLGNGRIQCRFCGLEGPMEDPLGPFAHRWNSIPRTARAIAEAVMGPLPP